MVPAGSVPELELIMPELELLLPEFYTPDPCDPPKGNLRKQAKIDLLEEEQPQQKQEEHQEEQFQLFNLHVDEVNHIFSFYSFDELCRLQTVSKCVRNSSIRAISLIREMNITQSNLMSVVRHCRNLRSIELGMFVPEKYFAQILKNNKKINEFNLCGFQEQHIYDLMESMAESLSSLKESFWGSTQFDILPLLRTRGAQVEKLDIIRFNEADVLIPQFCPQLESLDCRLSDGQVIRKELLQNLPKLKALHVVNISVGKLIDPRALRHLSKLFLKFDHPLFRSLSKLFVCPFPNLTDLVLDIVNEKEELKLEEMDISAIGDNCQALRNLELTTVSEFVDFRPPGLAYVLKNCSNLTRFCLDWYDWCLGEALLELSESDVVVPNLTNLDCNNFLRIEKSITASLFESVLPNLKILAYEVDKGMESDGIFEDICERSGLKYLERFRYKSEASFDAEESLKLLGRKGVFPRLGQFELALDLDLQRNSQDYVDKAYLGREMIRKMKPLCFTALFGSNDCSLRF